MLLAGTEGIEPHHAVYAEELRELIASRDVAFGQPLDLVPFAARLAEPGSFRSEMSSMVRAIIFREQESISQADLLALVCTAVGGPHVDLSDPALDKAGREILLFLGQALRSLWGRVPQETAEPTEAAEPAEPAAETLPPPTSPTPVMAARSAAPAPAGSLFSARLASQTVFKDAEQSPVRPMASPVESSRGLSLHPKLQPAEPVFVQRSLVGATPRLIEEVRVAPDVSWTPLVVPDRDDDADESERPRSNNVLRKVRALWRDPSPAQAGEGEYPEYSRLTLFTRERRPLWLVGASGIVLGLALGWGLRNDSQSPMPAVHEQAASGFHPWLPPIPQPTVDQGSSTRAVPAPAPKPSPYGDAVTSSRAQDDRRPGQSFALHGAARSNALPVSAMRRRVEAALAGRDEELAQTLPRPRESIFLSVSGPMAGNLLAAPAPVYPSSAIDTGIQGKVTVQSVVGADGKVISSRVLSGAAPLRDAALNAVRYWRYRPYLVDGVPTSVVTNATLDFQLAH